VVDAEWRLLRANRAGLDYLGLTFEDLARHESFVHYHPDDLDNLRKAIESVTRGVPEDFEGRAPSRRTVSLAPVPVRSAARRARMGHSLVHHRNRHRGSQARRGAHA